MYIEFAQILKELDKHILTLDNRQIQHELESVPLEIFGKLQIERPDEFPNLMNWLPVMPSAAIQQSWTGTSGHELMKQSVNFIRAMVSKYHEIACKPLNHGNILDFGCGWGRLIRLLYKYAPADNIYGVDPWDSSLNICRDTKLYGNFYLSEYLPISLPMPTSVKFDLILAFSVFTHLSEKTFNMSAAVIRESLSKQGVIALTIRPREYWAYIHDKSPFYAEIPLERMLEDHDQNGIAFYPHQREKIMGEVTYGETSVSLDYIKRTFPGMEIAGVEWSASDSMQILVFLKKQK